MPTVPKPFMSGKTRGSKMSISEENITNQDNLSYLDLASIYIYNQDSQEWQHPKSVDDYNTPLTFPFSLTLSNHQGQENGMTPSSISNGGKYAYEEIRTLEDFALASKVDFSVSAFENNHRGQDRFLQSDVLVVDIDNDEKNGDKDYWDDPKNWLLLDDFARMFSSYEYIIKTSRNHQKQKSLDDGTVRKPRDKFHAFFPLKGVISDAKKYDELLNVLQHFINKESVKPFTDKAVKGWGQLFSHRNSLVYYNKVEGGNIDDLLISGSFRNSYDEHIANSNGKSKSGTNGKVGENKTDGNAISENGKVAELLGSWDYKHIISRLDLNEIYDGLKPSGDEYIARCEIHNETNPSLQVMKHGGFLCYGCDAKSYNLLDYIAKKQNKKRWQVREYYCNKFGLDYNEYRMAENDVELAGYVPVTNIGHHHISFDDYRRLKELNEKYATCVIGSQVCVLRYTRTAYHQQQKADSYKIVEYQTFANFEKQFVDDFVFVKVKGVKDDDGEIKWNTLTSKTLGKVWLDWHKKRKYDRSTFFPRDEKEIWDDEKVHDSFDDWESGTWENGWSGDDKRRGLKRFVNQDRVEQITDINQAKEQCSLYLDHIKNRICGNYEGEQKEQLYNYIVKWMASCISKHLDDRVTTALVLKSSQEGSGKGSFVQFFGQLFGSYYFHLTEGSRLDNQFNMLMKDRLLVFVDESLFAGDKKMQAKVKGMQTENTFIVEPKGIDATIVNNHRRFIYASNSEWVVAKGGSDRRFVVIDVPNKKMTKQQYLEMEGQWNNGGKEAFYYYLMSDEMQQSIQDFDFEAEMVQTKGGMQQMMLTNPEIGWWHEILQEAGHHIKNPDTSGWSICQWNYTKKNLFTTQTDSIYQSFLNYMETSGGKSYSGRKGNLATLLKNLNDEGTLLFDNQNRDWKNNKMIWEFESIDDARKRWDEKYNNGVDSFGTNNIKTAIDKFGRLEQEK